MYSAADDRQIYCVSELNSEVRSLLEMSYPEVWVEGEISNLANPASGHKYFSLKDESAQIRCALFRNRPMSPTCAPAEGMHVLIRGTITLYENRGDYQLVVDYLEDAGEGALRRVFEVLKSRLANEGLFDADRKRDLPRLCKRIGVITSPTGAVIRDIISTFRRRYPVCSILVYPVPVQGKEAAQAITETIDLADRRAECDALILARGGGPLEDLWAFNEEVVARAIAHCSLPIVSAVGHEVDFTIADFVADVRAATPTAAAEMLSPDRQQLIDYLRTTQKDLISTMRNLIQQCGQTTDWLTRRLTHPRERLALLRNRLSSSVKHLHLLGLGKIRELRFVNSELGARLERCSPSSQLARLKRRQEIAAETLVLNMRTALARQSQRHALLTTRLRGVNPLATLDRGYAIVRDAQSNKVLRNANQTDKGRVVRADLAKGHIVCTVNETNP